VFTRRVSTNFIESMNSLSLLPYFTPKLLLFGPQLIDSLQKNSFYSATAAPPLLEARKDKDK
jgi:hypothetical protein